DFSRTQSQLISGPASAGTGTASTVVPVNFQGAGATGGFYSGGAKFHGTLNANYREGAWSFGVQFHLNGDAVNSFCNEGLTSSDVPLQKITYHRQTVNGVTQTYAIADTGQSFAGWRSTNYSRGSVQTDLRTSYKWSNNITLFANVDNVQDIPDFSNGG